MMSDRTIVPGGGKNLAAPFDITAASSGALIHALPKIIGLIRAARCFPDGMCGAYLKPNGGIAVEYGHPSAANQHAVAIEDSPSDEHSDGYLNPNSIANPDAYPRY